jgi:hypothetical protein
MLMGTTMSPFGYRLCRRVGLFVVAGVIAIEAVLLALSYGFYQTELLQNQENERITATSNLYVNNIDHSKMAVLGLSQTLVKQGILSGGILYDKSGQEIGRFGVVPGTTCLTSAPMEQTSGIA